MLEHWNGDRRNSRKMFQDLQQRGYRGSYPTLACYLRRLRAVDTIVAAGGLPATVRPTLDAAPRQALTPRTAAWTLLRRVEKQNMESQALLAGVRGRSPVLNEAVGLAEAFTALVRGCEEAQLDPWLQQAEHSAVPHCSALPSACEQITTPCARRCPWAGTTARPKGRSTD